MPPCVRKQEKPFIGKAYGAVNEWPPEVWAEYGEIITHCETNDYRPILWRCAQLARYILPPEGAISREEACRIALEKVHLDNTEVFVAFCCMDGDAPIWKIVTHTMRPEDMMSGRFSATWMVEIDCKTGRVNHADVWDYSDGAGKMYVPRSAFGLLEEENG